jgi:ribonucleotide monophosphatase NagD (HAD superfamily)
MGWTSILVRTGCFQSTDDNDSQHPATHVCPSITGTNHSHLSPQQKKKRAKN